MKTDANNSGSSSATTSQTAPPSEPNPNLTEAEFLQQEAARARAAISRALSDLGQNLKATADPHVLTRDHPWLAISTAAVAGFAAALTLIPSKEQQALRALAELERARHATPPQAAAASDKPATSAAAKPGIFANITTEVLKTVRPLLTTLITAGISRLASGGAASPPPETNGHTPDEQIPTPS
jgi:hypothetical protein